jgi:hypothetical protein
MHRLPCFIALTAWLSVVSFAFADAPLAVPATQPMNLLDNASLEQLNPRGIPIGFTAQTPWGAKATFASDSADAHSGQRSFKIHSDDSTQSWLVADAIDVAPGETITVSAWVKTKDIRFDSESEQTPAVQIMAAFINSDGHSDQFAEPAVAISAKTIPQSQGKFSSDWTHIQGDLKVPALAAKLYMRFGQYNAAGTSWWDDVEIHPHNLLVCRAELKSTRFSPDAGALPVTIINRAKQTESIHLQAAVGKVTAASDLQLTGVAKQSVSIPIAVAGIGSVNCATTLRYASGEVIFTETRNLTIPPPLLVLPPIPTHWAVEDGSPIVDGDVDIAVAHDLRDNAKLSINITDSAGTVEASWTNKEPLKDGWNHWQIKPALSIPVGRYQIEVALKSTSGQPIEGKQHWAVVRRNDARTTLNADGYLVADGQPVFPLGIFNGNAHLQEMADNGFTITHAYNAIDVKVGQPPDDLAAQEFVDETQRVGMKALFLVPREFVFHHDWDQVRRRIRMFKNHPSLLAWDEEEGIARGDMSPDDLKKLREIITEEDPNHPLMIGDSRDQIQQVTDRSNFFPVDQMDLGMWWWYPLPPGGPKSNALEGVELGKAMELAPPSFLTLRKTDKPIWVGVQAYKKPQAWARYPTETEYRAQAYISIIHGATGLLWYGGSVEDGVYENPTAGHWDYLKSLGKELHEMSPIFMAQTIDAPSFEPPDAPISVMLKKLGDRQVLLTANRGSKAIDINFSCATDFHSAKVLYESRDSVAISDGRLKDHFDPYQVHVYELIHP